VHLPKVHECGFVVPVIDLQARPIRMFHHGLHNRIHDASCVQSYRDTVAYLERIVGFLRFIHVFTSLTYSKMRAPGSPECPRTDKPKHPQRERGRTDQFPLGGDLAGPAG